MTLSYEDFRQSVLESVLTGEGTVKLLKFVKPIINDVNATTSPNYIESMADTKKFRNEFKQIIKSLTDKSELTKLDVDKFIEQVSTFLEKLDVAFYKENGPISTIDPTAFWTANRNWKYSKKDKLIKQLLTLV